MVSDMNKELASIKEVTGLNPYSTGRWFLIISARSVSMK
jgi:hypothetical protein